MCQLNIFLFDFSRLILRQVSTASRHGFETGFACPLCHLDSAICSFRTYRRVSKYALIEIKMNILHIYKLKTYFYVFADEASASENSHATEKYYEANTSPGHVQQKLKYISFQGQEMVRFCSKCHRWTNRFFQKKRIVEALLVGSAITHDQPLHLPECYIMFPLLEVNQNYVVKLSFLFHHF